MELIAKGMSQSEYKRIFRKLLNTGQCNPEDIERMDDYQRFAVNELKKHYRDILKQQ